MEFANPLGLLGLLSLPAIVAIHLFHRRFPPMLVAGLHLWGAEVRVPTSGRKRERLPLSASLLLELLAALMLTFVLAQPRWGDVGKVLHLIAVLDNSASMSAVGFDGTASRDRSIAELSRRMTDAPNGSRVTLIQTGRRPVMLAGPAVKWEDAKAPLAEWKPALPKHDFLPALDMAVQLAENGGTVLFLTDVPPDDSIPIPSQAEVVSVGESLSNVAITAARWTVDSSTLTGRVFLRIRNAGPRPASVSVEGRSGETVMFRTVLDLEPDGEVPLESEVPGGLGRIVVSIDAEGDALDLDSTVSLIEPKIRSIRIATAFPADHSAAQAVERVLRITPDTSPSDADSAHLLITNGTELPESRRDLWWLGIGPLPSAGEGTDEPKDLLGPYLLDKRDPVIDGISLGGVVWGGVQPVAFTATPLISAGNELLLSRLVGTQTTAFLLNIDLSRSNLTDSPDWPILISNLTELRRDSLPGLRRWNFRLNEDIQFRLFEGLSEPTAEADRKLTFQKNTEAESDSKPRSLARTSVVEIPAIDETGFFTIMNGDEPFGDFAINFFDSDESDLTRLAPGHQLPPVDQTELDYTIDNPFTWLILAGLILIMVLAFADWFVLRPQKSSAG